MAKRFEFDDEDDGEVYPEPAFIFKKEKSGVEPLEIEEPIVEPVVEPSLEDDDSQEKTYEDTYEEENQEMAKKKKKFVWKWWHYVLITLTVLFVAFMVYIFVLSNNDGPVIGHRADGIVVIEKDLQTAAVDTIKNKYKNEIQEMTLETRARQLRIHISFVDGMDTKKAQEIAEEAVQTLDGLVNKEKEEGKTYSKLFGKINNVAQYEVNLILTSNNSQDFPIYGTKHIQNDSFSYTYSSIKDQESHDKAQSNLKS